MLNFIKKMVGHTPEVTVVGYLDGELTFRSQEQLKFEAIKAIARLETEEMFEAVLEVETYDSAQQLYSGRAVESPDLVERLEVLYPPPPPEPEEEEEPFVERRAIERLKKGLGIMSPQLQGFKGLTYDVTRVGARLIADGPMEPDKLIDLRMELDDARLPPLEFKARVVWCQPRDEHQRQFYLGVTFEQMPEQQQEMLTNFLEGVRSTDEGVFTREYTFD